MIRSEQPPPEGGGCRSITARTQPSDDNPHLPVRANRTNARFAMRSERWRFAALPPVGIRLVPLLAGFVVAAVAGLVVVGAVEQASAVLAVAALFVLVADDRRERRREDRADGLQG